MSEPVDEIAKFADDAFDATLGRGPGLAGRTLAALTILLALGVQGGCRTSGPASGAPPAAPGSEVRTPPGGGSANPLADTTWRLVEFQSMDDSVGTVKPSDPALYTMSLQGDGTVSMRLNCNRASGTWSTEPSADRASGGFRFGPLAATSALCPPPSMDERIAADAGFVRGYLLRDGRLSLSLMADGGVYIWEPEAASPRSPSKR